RKRIEPVGSRAKSHRHPPVADVVQRHEFLGERDWMPEVRRRHQGSQAEARSRRGCCGERWKGPEPDLVPKRPPREVVIGPRVVEAKLLSGAPPIPGGRPALFGENKNSNSHGRHSTRCAPPAEPEGRRSTRRCSSRATARYERMVTESGLETLRASCG